MVCANESEETKSEKVLFDRNEKLKQSSWTIPKIERQIRVERFAKE